MDIEARKKKLEGVLNIAKVKSDIQKIEQEMTRPDFWNNREKATQTSQKLAVLNDLVKKIEQASTEEEIKELEKEALFSGPYDVSNAVLSIHAGAGGTEAQDWAGMLLRMYVRYAERKGWKATILDESRGEEAGMKSVSIEIIGHNAFGHLKAEAGVHRLVRISPFDADKARHTSFALVEVVPEIENIEDVEIDDKDLRVDVFKASGHGGQGVNTTDSAVRMTHIPTSIVVSVQNERSQLQNKLKAMTILKSRLKQKLAEEQKERVDELKGEFQKVEWGSQIRSYVLQPYQQVKDHRTGEVSNQPTAILDGRIDDFIKRYLEWTNHNNQETRIQTN